MITLNGEPIKPTFFPDSTSQVWKLNNVQRSNYVVWWYETENEFLHLAQLAELIASSSMLKIPYLPYARQDKPISNDSTFALRPFAKALNAQGWRQVLSHDVHNPKLTSELIKNFHNVPPNLDFLRHYDHIIYPDTGAYNRYYDMVSKFMFGKNKNISVYEKVRDQSTGRITQYSLFDGSPPKGNAVVIDDLCDGGATYMMLAKSIGTSARLSLYVTHGVFSKGLDELLQHYDTIHTTNSFWYGLFENEIRTHFKEQNRLKVQGIF